MNRRSWIGHIAAAIGSAFAGKAFARSNPVHVADTSAPVVSSGQFRPYSGLRRQDVCSPFEAFARQIRADEGYAWAWHCNIAMASKDRGMNHAMANVAAADFMKSAFDVDTTKHPGYSSILEADHSSRERIEIDPAMGRDSISGHQRFLGMRAVNYAILTGTYIKSAAYEYKEYDGKPFLEIVAEYTTDPTPGDRFLLLGRGDSEQDAAFPQKVTEESRQEAAARCGITLKPIGVRHNGEPA